MIRIRMTNNTQRVRVNLVNASRETLTAIGLLIVSEAKKLCPVDTGFLRSSIDSKVTGFLWWKKLRIFSDAEYAIFVHEGTRKMRKRPFVRNAVFNNINKIQALARRTYRRNMGGR